MIWPATKQVLSRCARLSWTWNEEKSDNPEYLVDGAGAGSLLAGGEGEPGGWGFWTTGRGRWQRMAAPVQGRPGTSGAPRTHGLARLDKNPCPGNGMCHLCGPNGDLTAISKKPLEISGCAPLLTCDKFYQIILG